MQYPTGNVVPVDVPPSVVEKTAAEPVRDASIPEAQYGVEAILVGLAVIAVALAIWRYFRFKRVRAEREADMDDDTGASGEL